MVRTPLCILLLFTAIPLDATASDYSEAQLIDNVNAMWCTRLLKLKSEVDQCKCAMRHALTFLTPSEKKYYHYVLTQDDRHLEEAAKIGKQGSDLDEKIGDTLRDRSLEAEGTICK